MIAGRTNVEIKIGRGKDEFMINGASYIFDESKDLETVFNEISNILSPKRVSSPIFNLLLPDANASLLMAVGVLALIAILVLPNFIKAWRVERMLKSMVSDLNQLITRCENEKGSVRYRSSVTKDKFTSYTEEYKIDLSKMNIILKNNLSESIQIDSFTIFYRN